MTPVWVFELDDILTKCETCADDQRLQVYDWAYDTLLHNETIPRHVREHWMMKIKYGFTWNLPRRMEQYDD